MRRPKFSVAAALPTASPVGGRLPAHATAVVKAMLAFSPPQLLEYIISAGVPLVGAATITDGKSLRAALADIVEACTASERNESAPDSFCAASPVMGRGGKLWQPAPPWARWGTSIA